MILADFLLDWPKWNGSKRFRHTGQNYTNPVPMKPLNGLPFSNGISPFVLFSPLISSGLKNPSLWLHSLKMHWNVFRKNALSGYPRPIDNFLRQFFKYFEKPSFSGSLQNNVSKFEVWALYYLKKYIYTIKRVNFHDFPGKIMVKHPLI